MKKSVLILFHLLFWVITCLLIQLVFQLLEVGIAIMRVNTPIVPNRFLFNFVPLLVILPIGACIFYTSYYTFHFFAKRPVRFGWLFVVYVIVTFAFCIPGYLASQRQISHKLDILQVILSLTLIISPILYFNIFGFLFRTFIEWISDRKIRAELEKDKLASQLQLLESKINPHFLFNTLNNIDVLIQDDPKTASGYLKKLSEILRFMLYESNNKKIPLSTEINYIQKYIDLEKIRTSNANFVKVEIKGDPDNKYISPMILIHFIENAFKYSTNKKIEDAIEIRFTISSNRLIFFCKNYVSSMQEPAREKPGLGITLLKQKLELLYKGAYNLNVKEENNWYLVNLEIQLDEN